ncbi:hypothetical protein GCM10009720_13100 [Yaniella flava]|uniref:Antitoxin n=1 Tax=Yaniella flava TaxID=287930 RepID=A0ABP5FY21_9MICC
MPKVIQIRGVPDDVHDALAESARAKGLSLTQYMLGQLEHLARLPQIARDNRATIRSIQKKVPDPVDRNTILSVLHEGRDE